MTKIWNPLPLVRACSNVTPPPPPPSPPPPPANVQDFTLTPLLHHHYPIAKSCYFIDL